MARPSSKPSPPLANDVPLAACTIIYRNYLSHARILANSFHQQVPNGRFYLLVIDGLPRKARLEPNIRVINIDELKIRTFYEMVFKYDVTELSTAVKPTLLMLLLNQFGEKHVAYFDPDILIMRPLNRLSELLQTNDIVLTPHLLTPIPLDGLKPSEQDIMLAGAYNLGFIGISNAPTTHEFLDWWAERLSHACRIDHANALFVDQRWIDLVPGYFPRTAILRDPAYNVAYWNLHERRLSRRGKDFYVNGGPLVFFHFSGFNPDEPQKLSRHQTRFAVNRGSVLRDLLSHYVDLHMKHGYEISSKWTAGRLHFSNGVAVHPLLRRLYLELDKRTRQSFGNLLDAEPTDSFFQWAIRPQVGRKRLSPFLEFLYNLRYDLAAVFPDVHGRNREKFVRWAATSGAREMQYDARLVPNAKKVFTSHTSQAEEKATKQPNQWRQVSAEEYSSLVERVRQLAREVLPRRSVVLVISKGDTRLLELKPHTAWHFPQTTDGSYPGYYPANSGMALAHLKMLRAQGAQFLLIPMVSLWWLTHYTGLRRYLERYCRLTFVDERCCVIFDVAGSTPSYRARQQARERIEAAITAALATRPCLGVNVAGYIASEKGVGEGVRSDIRCLEAVGMPYVLNKITDTGSVNADATFKNFSIDNPYRVNLIHINADQMPGFVRAKGERYFRGRYNIAYWAWELSRFPSQWSSSFRHLQEIWVPSAFTLDAVSRLSPVPVLRMPHAIESKPGGTRSRLRGLRNSDGKFVFLFVFDFHSDLERKNPIGLVRAFKKAFRSDNEALLVLKSAHSKSCRADKAALRRAIGKTKNIRLLDRVMSRRELFALMSRANCYISLHRSEGFGLTLAESMNLGKPVIATGYSGNLDFMTAANSFLVNYHLVEIARDRPPYQKGYVWAEPDLNHAAELMRLVREDSDVATRVARRGQSDVRQVLSAEMLGQLVKERLMSLRVGLSVKS